MEVDLEADKRKFFQPAKEDVRNDLVKDKTEHEGSSSDNKRLKGGIIPFE